MCQCDHKTCPQCFDFRDMHIFIHHALGRVPKSPAMYLLRDWFQGDDFFQVPCIRWEIGEFWAQVDKSPTCWQWTGPSAPGGYGTFFGRLTDGMPAFLSAHRYSAVMAFGNPPDGWVIHHTCRNRSCVNPDHLQYLTRSDHARLHGAEIRELVRAKWPRKSSSVSLTKTMQSGSSVTSLGS